MKWKDHLPIPAGVVKGAGLTLGVVTVAVGVGKGAGLTLGAVTVGVGVPEGANTYTVSRAIEELPP